MDQKRQLITYPAEDAKEKPVVSIGGREYAVMPYESEVNIPQQLYDFVERHPERDDVSHAINNGAERLLADILEYLRDAVAVTAVEGETGDGYRRCRLLLPVLMPVDTREKWGRGWNEESWERLQREAAGLRQTGKPYVFKMSAWKEGEQDSL